MEPTQRQQAPAMDAAAWERMSRAEQDEWRTAHGTWPSDPGGTLAGFLASGRRVEVTCKYGDGTAYTERGYIGRSTGWCPTWLLIKTNRSYGGAPLDAERIVTIRAVGTRTRGARS